MAGPGKRDRQESNDVRKEGEELRQGCDESEDRVSLSNKFRMTDVKEIW